MNTKKGVYPEHKGSFLTTPDTTAGIYPKMETAGFSEKLITT
jgi:hypothetical protein